MNTDTIKSRIAKLLRLANDAGASEAEAANAMAKASQLMKEHSISQAEAQDVSEGLKVEWGKIQPAHNKQNWCLTVLSAVQELYDVKFVKYGRTRNYRFAGTPDAIEAAEQTYLWLIEQINSIYKVHLKQFNGSMTYEQRCEYRESFKHGCAMRLYQRAHEIKANMRNMIPNHKALVVVENKVEEGITQLFGEMGVKTSRALKIATGSGSRSGFAAGNGVQLQRSAKADYRRIA